MTTALRLWLNDERPAPKGWIRAHTAEEAIQILRTGYVAEASIDHDLGKDKTGYDVLCWIEERVSRPGFEPPILHVHSANPPGRARMQAAIIAIAKIAAQTKAADACHSEGEGEK